MAIDGGGDFHFPRRLAYSPNSTIFSIFDIPKKKGGGIDGEKVSGDRGENDIGFSLHTCFSR